MHKSSFSIVCCFYNEINILKTKFVNFLNDLSYIEYEFEIIICDNKSDDGTTEYLKDLEKNYIFVERGQSVIDREGWGGP